jgi:hypothetical protein
MSSDLHRFARTLHRQAAAVIGEETIVFGGGNFAAVLAESDESSEYGDAYREPGLRLQAVARTGDLPATLAVTSPVSARGVSYRVDSIRRGGLFTTLILAAAVKA